MSRERFPCGCVADHRAWLILCPEHKHDVDRLRAAHRADMAARRPPEEDSDHVLPCDA